MMWIAEAVERTGSEFRVPGGRGVNVRLVGLDPRTAELRALSGMYTHFEMLVLGAAMLNGALPDEPSATREMMVELGTAKGLVIWDAIAAIEARGIRLDLLVLSEHLEEEGLLEIVGGAEALVEILECFPPDDGEADLPEDRKSSRLPVGLRARLQRLERSVRRLEELVHRLEG